MMEYQTLTAQRYLRPGEAFHLARRALEPGPIKVIHDHDYFELFWIDAGQATHVINGRTTLLAAGEGALIRPADCHGFSPEGAAPCRLVNVMFRAETAAHLVRRYDAEFAGRLFWQAGAEPWSFALDAARRSRFDEAFADLAMGPRTLARIEGFLLTLLANLSVPEPALRAVIPAWLDAALRAAQRPEIFRAGARGFVGAASRSHEHVCRALKAHLDVTPSVLVNRIRMEHAARLLAGTDLSTPDIAADCGLDNLSHFHTLFREQFGMTPRQYRLRRQRDPVQPAQSDALQHG